MLGLLRRDEGKPHRLCFAKNAAAFLRMSRFEDPILFAEPGQLLPLRRRQAGAALRAIGLRVPDSIGQGGRRQIQVARHGADRLALIQQEPNRAGHELLGEPPPRPSSRLARSHSGHRIRPSEDVHQTGSGSPEAGAGRNLLRAWARQWRKLTSSSHRIGSSILCALPFCPPLFAIDSSVVYQMKA